MLDASVTRPKYLGTDFRYARPPVPVLTRSISIYPILPRVPVFIPLFLLTVDSHTQSHLPIAAIRISRAPYPY